MLVARASSPESQHANCRLVRPWWPRIAAADQTMAGCCSFFGFPLQRGAAPSRPLWASGRHRRCSGVSGTGAPCLFLSAAALRLPSATAVAFCSQPAAAASLCRNPHHASLPQQQCLSCPSALMDPFVMAAAGGRGHSGCLEHHAAVWQVQVRCTACCTASSCETSRLIALAVELAALPGLSMCPARLPGCSIA